MKGVETAVTRSHFLPRIKVQPGDHLFLLLSPHEAEPFQVCLIHL